MGIPETRNLLVRKCAFTSIPFSRNATNSASIVFGNNFESLVGVYAFGELILESQKFLTQRIPISRQMNIYTLTYATWILTEHVDGVCQNERFFNIVSHKEYGSG